MTNLNTDTTGQTITAQRGHIQALAFARKGGDKLSEMLSGIATAKAAEREGPLHTFLFLNENYTDDEKHVIPYPGSKKDETGNKPYDKYTSVVDTKEGKKNVPGSWFTDVVKTTAAWMVCNQRIIWCGGQTEGMPEDISAMGEGERLEEIKNLRRFISDMRTGLVNGARVFHQAEAINSLNPARIRVKMPIKRYFKLDAAGQRIKVVDPPGENRVHDAVGEERSGRPEAYAGHAPAGILLGWFRTAARQCSSHASPRDALCRHCLQFDDRRRGDRQTPEDFPFDGNGSRAHRPSLHGIADDTL